MSTIISVVLFAVCVAAVIYVLVEKEETPKISFKGPSPDTTEPVKPVEPEIQETAKAPKVKRKYGGKVKGKKTKE